MADLTQFKPTLGDNDYPTLINNLIDQLQVTEDEVSGSSGTYSTTSDRLSAIDTVLGNVTSTEIAILSGATATTAELNLLDGVTATTAELNLLDGVTATTAELNLLDGVTATTAEINLLDGVTATTAEINLLDGVTATTAELNLLDGATATNTTASKAAILDSNSDLTIQNNTTSASIRVGAATGFNSNYRMQEGGSNSGVIWTSSAAASLGVRKYVLATGAIGSEIHLNESGAITIPTGYMNFETARNNLRIDGTTVTASAAELNYLEGANTSNSTSNKAVILSGANLDLTSASGELRLNNSKLRLGGILVNATATELNVLDSPTLSAMRLSAAVTSLAANVTSAIIFNETLFNRNSEYDVKGVFTPLATDYYYLSFNVDVIGTLNANTSVRLYVWDSTNSQVIMSSYIREGTGATVSITSTFNASCINRLIVGYPYIVQLYNGSGNDITLSAGGTFSVSKPI